MPPFEQSRVFISYARSDGSKYAAWLRERLKKEHPEIPLWQDVISERAGKDWWLQITDALDHVAYMVVVATPDAMQSEAVLKEWRYARQQGVCVLPVQASDALNFDSFPRWMRTKQFANLKVKAQWELFVGDLHRPHDMPRVPFMAEDLPKDFVARPEEFEPLIQLLLDKKREQRNPVAITTALRGAGGFGKTTLAKAVCHDDRIQEVFDDGVLWVTLGEKVDNLPGKVAELTTMLSGERSDFGSLVPAVTKLRELLADRDILMVIDDVWDPAHLDPFLQGGPQCARLITTRNLDTLPRQCCDVKVDSMQPNEAAELLGAGLPAACKPQIVALAERVGNWPLLLGIVNGVLRERVNQMHQPLVEAIAYANRALHRRGLTAFDAGNTKARNRAVELTVDVSLELFSPAQRERVQELAIFREDMDIPLNVVETLWQATGGLDDFEVQELCVRLHRRSLLQALDLAARQLRLHDVMRSYLQTELARHGDARLVHGKLVDAWGGLRNLPEAYAWHSYAYHMAAAGREQELRRLLLDPGWLQAKLDATDVTSLITDFDRLPEDEALRLLQGAVRLSAHVIGKDPSQFASQMVGRLLTCADMPAIERFSGEVVDGAQTRWLRPLQAVLRPPGTGLICVLEGHTRQVKAVAVTMDGKVAVSASDDRTLKVWEVGGGRELRTLAGHMGGVWGVVLSGDGRIAISASDDQTLKMWEVGSGRELRTLTGHTDSVRAVALTSDGKMAVSASDDQTLKVWDLESGRELRTLKGHAGLVLAVALTPDGQRAVSASSDQTLKVWELASGRELHTLTGHGSLVNAVAVTPNGQHAISGSWKELKVWELACGRELRTLTGHSGWVYAVAATPDGQRAVSASEDQTLKVWDLASGRELRTLTGHSSGVNAVAVTADGERAASASDDQTVKVWELASGRELRTLTGHLGWVYAMAVTPDGRWTVSASDDGTLKVWDLASGRELHTLTGHASRVTAVAVTPDGQCAISASEDQTLKVWELASGRKLRTLITGHAREVTAVAVTPDGQHGVSASDDGTLKVWELGSGRELRTLKGHADFVTAVAVTPDGQCAVSASSDQTLKVWDLASGRELRTLKGHSDHVTGVVVTPDGQRLVSASSDQTLKVWELGGHELRTLSGHSGPVRAVAVTPNGQCAVSASDDRTVKVWDLETGEVLATFTGDWPAHCCAFSDALNLIVAGDAGGHVHFLRLEEPKAKG